MERLARNMNRKQLPQQIAAKDSRLKELSQLIREEEFNLEDAVTERAGLSPRAAAQVC